MDSILQQHEQIQCPNCPNIINSWDPVCSKCGLAASEDGVIELAKLSEVNSDAESDAAKLHGYSRLLILFIVLAWILSHIDTAFAVIPLLAGYIQIGMFWKYFFSWRRKYRNIDKFESIVKSALAIRNRAVALEIILTGILVLYSYHLWQ